jgi:hypothetical protein
MRNCYLILTDSGGVQEEAPSLGKPVLVMRDRTERPEGVASGTVRLVGTETSRIVREVRSLLHDQRIYRKMVRPHNPYGDGKAGRRIVNSLKRHLQHPDECSAKIPTSIKKFRRGLKSQTSRIRLDGHEHIANGLLAPFLSHLARYLGIEIRHIALVSLLTLVTDAPTRLAMRL